MTGTGEPVHEVVAVRLHDGVVLETDVVRPAAGGRYPAVLYRTPYGREGCWLAYDPRGWARRGWVVVVQDVRGRYGSTGTFDPLRQEGPDGEEVISWVAGQPWSNGSVVMSGASYIGFTQWHAARRRPAALRAIGPQIAGADGHDGWASEGGVPLRTFVDLWSLTIASTDVGAPARARRRAAELRADPVRLFATATRPSRAVGALVAAERWSTPNEDLDVRALTWGRRVPDVPAFQIAGWFDPFVESALAAHTAMRRSAPSARARDGQRLVIGPWAHNGALPRAVGDVDFGPSASAGAQDLFGQLERWLRRAASGARVAGGVRAFALGSNRWLRLPSWPPPSTALRLRLEESPDGDPRAGLLDAGSGTRSARRHELARVTFDVSDPVPTRGGRILAPPPFAPGPVDQRPLDQRRDVVTFTTPPLPRRMRIAGTVRARLLVSGSGPVATVTAKLVDVHPDGVALNVVDSVRRTVVGPDTITPVSVELGSIVVDVARGHRLRLDVSWSNYPRLDIACELRERGRRRGWLAVHGGGRPASWLELPVLSR